MSVDLGKQPQYTGTAAPHREDEQGAPAQGRHRPPSSRALSAAERGTQPAASSVASRSGRTSSSASTASEVSSPSRRHYGPAASSSGARSSISASSASEVSSANRRHYGAAAGGPSGTTPPYASPPSSFARHEAEPHAGVVPKAPAAWKPPAPIAKGVSGHAVAGAKSRAASKPSLLGRLKNSLQSLSQGISQNQFAKGCLIGAAGLIVLAMLSSNPFLLAAGIALMGAGIAGYLLCDPHAKPIPRVSADEGPGGAAAFDPTEPAHKERAAAGSSSSADSGSATLTPESLASLGDADPSPAAKRDAIVAWERQSHQAEQQRADHDRAQHAGQTGHRPSPPPEYASERQVPVTAKGPAQR